MKKKYLDLLISEELVKRAGNHGMNLSAFLEIKLQEHLALIEGKSINHNHYSQQNNKSEIKNKDDKRAYGLVVMTSPSHGGGLRFKSG